MPIKVHCKYDALVDISKLKPHPKNRNMHPVDQIERLAEILQYQGIRAPIVVDAKDKKTIVKGHGTVQAIAFCKEKKAPVVYQKFADEEQQYAFVQSDNAIANWADLDLSGINSDLENLGPDFDLKMLGIKDFILEPAELPNLPEGDRDHFQQMTFTVSDEQAEQVKAALEKAKGKGDFDSENENSNGNALARICETYLTKR